MSITKTTNKLIEESLMSEIKIPAGYAMRANGDLVKLENLTALEREEDTLVKALFPRAKALHDDMARFKYDAMHMIEAVIKRCITEHGIKRFEKIKGNVSFTSIDGQYRVERTINEKIEANSSIESARQLFEQYTKVLEQQSGDDAKEFLSSYFRLNKGQYVTSRLVELCNKNINHPLYKQARAALQEALFVSSSKAYVRFYIRNKKDDSWEGMALQFSSIPMMDTKEESPADEEDD